MIAYLFKLIKCKITKHNWVDAGRCPFTGSTYSACVKCGKTVAV